MSINQSDTQYFFSLGIDYGECGVLYQQSSSSVILTSECGRRVQIPATRLRPFVTSLGIKGRFRMTVNRANKIIAFEKMR